MKNSLTTARAVSRPLTESDYAKILPIFTDPLSMAYLPKSGGEEGAMRFMENHLSNVAKYGHSMDMCFLKEDENTFIGLSGLTPMENVNGHFEIELGYVLHRNFWNKGFASELGAAYLKKAKSAFGYAQVISLIPLGHKASERVAVKLGLRFETVIQYIGDPYSIFRINFFHETVV